MLLLALDTWSGQFHVLQNEPHQFGPYAGAFHGAVSGGARPELYVVLQPLSPYVQPAMTDLLPLVGSVFERESLSLTGTLIRCIAAIHEQLRAWNQRSIPANRAGVAVAGIALRGQQAYLAQAGPAASYLRRNGEVRRIVPPQEAAAPLGLALTAEPDFTYFALRPGDVFLLAFATLEQHMTQEAIAKALGGRPDRALADLYRGIADEPEFASLIVAVEPPEGTPIDLPPLPPRAEVAPAPPPAATPAVRAAPRRRPVDDRQAALFDETAGDGEQEAPPEQAAASIVEPPAPVAPEAPTERPRRPLDAPRRDPEVESRPDREPLEIESLRARPRRSLDPSQPPPIPFDRRVEEPVHEQEGVRVLRQPEPVPGPEAVVEPVAEAPEEMPSILEPEEAAERLRRIRKRPRHTLPAPPEGTDVDPASGNPYEQVGTPPDLVEKVGLGAAEGPALRRGLDIKLSRRNLFFAAAVLAGGAAVAGAAVAIPRVLSDDREERVRQLVDEARQAVQRAAGTDDIADRRAALVEARGKLEEALALLPEDRDAVALSDQVAGDLRVLNKEVDLAGVEQITALTTVLDAPGAASAMRIAGGSVYLIDRSAGEVINFSLADPRPVIVYQQGRDIEDVPAEAPHAIVYLASADAADLLISAEDGQDYLYGAGDDLPTPVAIPGRASWASVDGLEWTGSELLVLDLEGSSLHHYSFDGEAFEAGTVDTLDRNVPAGAISVTWSGERLYVLSDSEQLLRLDPSGLRLLDLVGIDRPLRSPQSIAADSLTGDIYISDRGNNRIVVVDRDGTFLRQLVGPELSSLSHLSVDADTAFLYFLAGDALYQAPLEGAP